MAITTATAATMIVNMTTVPDDNPPYNVDALKRANSVVQTSILAFVMVAMGCVISFKDIKTSCRRPVGVLVGFVCQFILMPLLTFSLAHALQIESSFAIGMLVIGCSPGGTVSNLFTLWTDGDVCLSVLMTTASTILAFGMMPLNLFIYSRSWTDENSVIPYTDIMLALVSILVPVALGMLLRYKWRKVTPYVIKFGSIFGIMGIAVGVVLNGFINPNMFTSGWKVWFAALTLPYFGFGLGYTLARILRQSHRKCRTISFETGSQNVALSLTLILLTFSDAPDFNDLITFPSLYAIFIFVDALVCVLIYKLVMWKTGAELEVKAGDSPDVDASDKNKDSLKRKEGQATVIVTRSLKKIEFRETIN